MKQTGQNEKTFDFVIVGSLKGLVTIAVILEALELIISFDVFS